MCPASMGVRKLREALPRALRHAPTRWQLDVTSHPVYSYLSMQQLTLLAQDRQAPSERAFVMTTRKNTSS